jgi:hypothetical protein
MCLGENVAVTVSEHARWRRRVEDAAAITILGGLAALPDPSFWTSLLLVTVALVVPPAPAPLAQEETRALPEPWTNDNLTPGYTGCRQWYPGGRVGGVYWRRPIPC